MALTCFNQDRKGKLIVEVVKGIWDGLVTFWTNIFEFASAEDKMTWTLIKLGEGVKVICESLAQQDFVFAVGAMVGAYFIIAGNKNVGTKITSMSIILFVALKVVAAI